MTKETFNFEKSFSRLEEILDKMSSEKISLDDSIKLYEEADGLIKGCSKRLSDAEKKVEKLLKTRDGELELDEGGDPLSEEYN